MRGRFKLLHESPAVQFTHTFELQADVVAVSFDRSGRFLLASAKDARVYSWEVESGRLCNQIQADQVFTSMASKPGQLALGSSRWPGQLWSIDDDGKLSDRGIRFSPSKRLCSFSFGPGPDLISSCCQAEGVELWSIDTGFHQGFLPAPGRVHRVAASWTCDRLACSLTTGNKVWMGNQSGLTSSLQPQFQAKGLLSSLASLNTVERLEWAHDGSTLGVCTDQSLVILGADGAQQTTLQFSSFLGGSILALDFSANLERFVRCAQLEAAVFEVPGQVQLAKLEPHLRKPGGYYHSAGGALSPDGKLFAHQVGPSLRLYSIP